MLFGSRDQSEAPGHSSRVRNALTENAPVDARQGLRNYAATYVEEKNFESSDEML